MERVINMNQCKKCGAELFGDTVCPNCGTKQRAPEVVTGTPSVRCPKCGSHDAQYCVENDAHTEGKNYSAGKGCIGYLLLGPLGLLCGLCGKGKKTVIVNRGYWICKQCGNKFKDRAQLQAEIKRCRGNVIRFTIAGVLFVAVLLIISAILSTNGASALASTLALSSIGVFLVFALATLAEILSGRKLKQELNG